MTFYANIKYEKGDLAEARHWSEQAVKTGYASSVGNFAAWVSHTPNNLDYPQDLIKGYALMSLLKELDGGGNLDTYAEQKLPQIAAKMTPDQIELAKIFAQDWKTTHPPLSFFPDKLGY